MKLFVFIGIALSITLLFQGCSVRNEEPTVNELTLLSDEKKAQEYNISTQDSYAVFSGGCFWCVEKDFEKIEGVKEVLSGYSSNNTDDKTPYYRAVASGKTNFRESVAVIYDDSVVSYEELVRTFFTIHDPTDEGGSFNDRGFQYTSAIYYKNKEEQEITQRVIQEFEDLNVFINPIITSVEPLKNFYIAEEYHQDYSDKNPNQYRLYRLSSGRDDFIEEVEERIESTQEDE
ncbi:MAG: peptide-methionine (S)-S-oxide reductase MsrA [Candidatus Nanoarchaeia archaeon]